MEFWDEDDGSWSGRTIVSQRPRPSSGSSDERELDVAASEGLALIAEQLAEGMVDRSFPAALQSWAWLREVWKDESPDFDVERLFERAEAVPAPSTAEVGTWLVHASAGPYTMQGWWSEHERILEADVAAARSALEQHAHALLPHLLLLLRWPHYPVVQLARSALLARPRNEPDESEIFAVLLDLLVHPPTHDNLIAPGPFAERLSSLPERVDALAAFVRTTPYLLTTDPLRRAPSREGARAYQDGQSALAMLACWAETDPRAAEALRAVRDPLSRRQNR